MSHEVPEVCVRIYIRGEMRRDDISKRLEIGNMLEDLRQFRETGSNM
jgi:hypothetical protein